MGPFAYREGGRVSGPGSEGGLFRTDGRRIDVVRLECKRAQFRKIPILLNGAGPVMRENTGVSPRLFTW